MSNSPYFLNLCHPASSSGATSSREVRHNQYASFLGQYFNSCELFRLSESKKTQKAEELGVKIIGIEYLREILDGKVSLDEL